MRYSSRPKRLIRNCSSVRSGFTWLTDALRVADADLHGAREAQFLQRVGAETNGVIEELAQEIDARLAVANQHHAVSVGGCGGSPVRPQHRGFGAGR